MSFLIDTNIISEVRKGPRCDLAVAQWFEAVAEADLYLSVLVLGEIRKGIEQVRPKAPDRADGLEAWLSALTTGFSSRILPVDRAVTDAWGRMSAVRTVPVIDGLMVATALVHDMTLVTRNEADVAELGARVLNPFTAPIPRP
jgi:predicted nucleic acid-binding protein